MRTAIARWWGDVLYYTFPIWSPALCFLEIPLLIVAAIFRKPSAPLELTFIEAPKASPTGDTNAERH